MLIDIKVAPDETVKVAGIQQYNLNEDRGFWGIIRSANHPEMPADLDKTFGIRLQDYLNHYVNDSVCLFDKTNNRFLIGRDWPGNVMLYYWIATVGNSKRLIVSNELGKLAAEVPGLKASEQGIRLFLTSYKHHHSQTIYERVEILPPGFSLDFDLTSGRLSVEPWFNFHRHIAIKNPRKALQIFRSTVDASIQRIVSKEDKIALMLSGGTDSTLLLDRLFHLGYKNVTLFTAELAGQNARVQRAEARARTYGFELECIETNPQAYKEWLEIIGKTYTAPSDARPNGWLLELPHVYKRLSEHYSGQSAHIMWGYANAFHSPYIPLKRIPFILLAYILSRFVPIAKGDRLNSIGHFIIWLIGKIHFIQTNKVTISQKQAIEKALIDFINDVRHPDELLNLKSIFGYVKVQEWIMHRFQNAAELYYPQAHNVWPFFDRRFQEVTMTISLRARFGGTANWFNMFSVKSRKNLILKAIERTIPQTTLQESLLGGNSYSRPSMRLLYQHQACYCAINDIFLDPKSQTLLEHLSKQHIFIVPGSFDEFCNLSLPEIEKLSGVLMMLKHFELDKVAYSCIDGVIDNES